MHVGDQRLDLVGDAPLGGGRHGALEHRGRDVGGHEVEALAGADPPQRDPAAAGDVEHPGAGGQPADLGGGVVQLAEVAAGAEPPQRPPTRSCSTSQS